MVLAHPAAVYYGLQSVLTWTRRSLRWPRKPPVPTLFCTMSDWDALGLCRIAEVIILRHTGNCKIASPTQHHSVETFLVGAFLVLALVQPRLTLLPCYYGSSFCSSASAVMLAHHQFKNRYTRKCREIFLFPWNWWTKSALCELLCQRLEGNRSSFTWGEKVPHSRFYGFPISFSRRLMISNHCAFLQLTSFCFVFNGLVLGWEYLGRS